MALRLQDKTGFDAGMRTRTRTDSATPVLWIIIPCYNETEVLPITIPMFKDELSLLKEKSKVSQDSRILLVDDGSKDGTWELISRYSAEDDSILGISQSRNRGHQNALLAGLMEAKEHCDITITIDCDGQDSIFAMEEMVDAYHSGAEIVYGVRSDRKTDSWFKRTTAQGLYKLLSLWGAEVIYNHSDYRLVSSRVLQYFSDFKEVNIYLRGMFPLVGFNSTSVYYERRERLAGESRYPLKKNDGAGLGWNYQPFCKADHVHYRSRVSIFAPGVCGNNMGGYRGASFSHGAGVGLYHLHYLFYRTFSIHGTNDKAERWKGGMP